MCSAVAALMGVQVAGGVMSAAGEREKGAASNNYYQYLASQNDVEAKVTAQRADISATGIQDQAFLDEKARQVDVRKVEGAQTAALAAHGIGGGSKLAENLAMDTLSQSEKDAAALRYNANVKVYESNVAASDRIRALKGQATAYRYAGANALSAGDTNATSSLLGTATNVAGSWLSYNKTSKGNY